MMKILVTGGAGFIGSNFIRFVLGQDPEVVIYNLDLLTYAGNLANLADLADVSRHIFIEGDICDRRLLEEIIFENQIEAIVHFAAETHVDRSLHQPELFYRTNFLGTLSLLEAARSYWEEKCQEGLRGFRFHHISTDEVFGSLKIGEPPFKEDSPYAPTSAYAASKAASDIVVRLYYQVYGLPVTITASSNNYGPYQHPEKFFPLVCLNGMKGRSIPIYGSGDQVRDWLFVDDHCLAIWTVLHKGDPGETYLVGGGTQLTNLEISRMICQEMDEMIPDPRLSPRSGLIIHISDRPGHDQRYAVNYTKIASRLDWNPGVALEDGIKKTVQWYQSNPAWIDHVTSDAVYQSWIKDHYQDRLNS